MGAHSVILAVSLLAIVSSYAVDSRAAEGQRIPECGMASLYATMRTLGRSVELDELRQAFQKELRRDDLTTVSLAELAQVAEAYGLYTAALRTSPGDFRAVPLPAILYLKIPRPRQPGLDVGHFVVARATDGNQVQLIDLSSTNGWRWVPITKLQEVWRGELLAISAEPVRIPSPWLRRAAVFCFALGAVALGTMAYSAICGRLRREVRHAPEVMRSRF